MFSGVTPEIRGPAPRATACPVLAKAQNAFRNGYVGEGVLDVVYSVYIPLTSLPLQGLKYNSVQFKLPFCTRPEQRRAIASVNKKLRKRGCAPHQQRETSAAPDRKQPTRTIATSSPTSPTW
jgi:hypothetical protein